MVGFRTDLIDFLFQDQDESKSVPMEYALRVKAEVLTSRGEEVREAGHLQQRGGQRAGQERESSMSVINCYSQRTVTRLATCVCAPGVRWSRSYQQH